MAYQKETSLAKKFLYTLITIVLLLLIIEGILSVYFYHKYGKENFAILEAGKALKGMLKTRQSSANVENQKLVRPAASDEMNRQIAEEIANSNRFSYEPWIEFKNIDYNGKYVNITNGVRKSIPDAYFNLSSKDTVDIFFLGGSTTFGFNLADSETIPSQFVRLYQQLNPSGKSIRVYNYGTPTYYSLHEQMLFTKLLFEGKHPGLAVFLDGVNDFWFAKVSYYDQSYFSYILRQIFNQELLTAGKFNFTDTADKLFKDPVNVPLNQFNDTLISHYFRNIQNIQRVSVLAGTKCYFFCQPVPFYKYPNQQKDPICFKDQHTRFEYIYPIIEKKADSLPNFTFLGNMLEKETGYPFVDGLHYSPEFTTKVTQRILEKIINEINK